MLLLLLVGGKSFMTVSVEEWVLSLLLLLLVGMELVLLGESVGETDGNDEREAEGAFSM